MSSPVVLYVVGFDDENPAMRSVVAIFLIVGAVGPSGCSRSRGGWSDGELEQFSALCSPGHVDPACQCLAKEVPPLVSFAEYKAFRAVSQFEPGAKLDDGVLAKMAHAAAVCASRAH